MPSDADQQAEIVDKRFQEYLDVVRRDGKNAARRWNAYVAWQHEREKLDKLEKPPR
jgi:hypothetical protein